MIWATRGGVTVGLALLLWQWFKWWPGRKALMKKPLDHVGRLLPFLLAWSYGALGVLSVMGLIGWFFDAALWASNWLGDAALWLGVGQKAGVSSQGAYLPLTADGTSLVFLATVAFVAAVKFRPALGGELRRGAWCGACLGTSAGVAGLAAVPLAQAANWVGGVAYGAVS